MLQIVDAVGANKKKIGTNRTNRLLWLCRLGSGLAEESGETPRIFPAL